MKAKVNIDNTRFIFDTNFSGDPNRDRYGSSRRRVNVVIPTEEQARQLIEMGLNVKQTKPNPNYIYDEPFVPTFYVPVTVNMGLEFNRPLYNADAQMYDYVVGTFLIVGLTEDDFGSLSDEMIEKYTSMFRRCYGLLEDEDGKRYIVCMKPKQ